MGMEEIKRYVAEHRKFEMPDFQEQFALSYSDASKTLEELEKSGIVRFYEGFTYEAVSDSAEKNSQPVYSPKDEQEAFFIRALWECVKIGDASTSIIQRRLSCSYARAAHALDWMEENNFVGPHPNHTVKMSVEDYYAKFGNPSRTPEQSEDEDRERYIEERCRELMERLARMSENDDEKDEDDDEEDDPREALIRQRRRELMERLARMAEEGEEDDDDDEEYDELDDDDDSLDIDEDDDDEDEVDYDELQKVIEKRRQELLQRLDRMSADCESKDKGNKSLNQEPLKLIEGFDYGNLNNISQSIIMKLRVFNIRLVTKAIQIGKTKTRYVFDVVSPQTRINEIKCYADDIRACIGADKKANILAPYGNDRQVAVEVDNDYTLDPYCKKALLYWLKYHGGIASIASIQRRFGIGFNRSGRILDELQKFNCVERLNASEPSTKPIYVTITQEDINGLFPKSMGWED